MTSAATCARVSSARQKKDQTIGSQTQALRQHAEQNRLEVPEEWVFEDEGHSGATLGPEKITIRHRIPARTGSTSTGSHDADTDTEGDHAPGYPLRWGRDNSYLVRWARRKYKRLRSFKKVKKWWDGLTERQPRMFAHWRISTGFQNGL